MRDRKLAHTPFGAACIPCGKSIQRFSIELLWNSNCKIYSSFDQKLFQSLLSVYIVLKSKSQESESHGFEFHMRCGANLNSILLHEYCIITFISICTIHRYRYIAHWVGIPHTLCMWESMNLWMYQSTTFLCCSSSSLFFFICWHLCSTLNLRQSNFLWLPFGLMSLIQPQRWWIIFFC